MGDTEDNSLPVGTKIAGFEIKGLLGNGNMGIVYRATQVNLNRDVALKILFSNVAEDQDFLRGFFREAQAAAAFTHQNIVQAYDVGQTNDGVYYFAMELIDGGDIGDRINEIGKIPPKESLILMVGVADGLAYGFKSRQLTHGDIKPANILLTPDGKTKLADLGLARMGGEIQGENEGILLTPHYAAPEMIAGEWEVGDSHADMYSFGATLYHMMAGHPVFNEEDFQIVIDKHSNEAHTPLHEIDESIPKNISDFIDKLLEKNPEDRPADWYVVKKQMTNLIKGKKLGRSFKLEGRAGSKKENKEEIPEKKKNPFVFIFLFVLIAAIAGYFYYPVYKKNLFEKDQKELMGALEKQEKFSEALIMIDHFIEKYGEETPPNIYSLKKELEGKEQLYLDSLKNSSLQNDVNKFINDIEIKLTQPEAEAEDNKYLKKSLKDIYLFIQNSDELPNDSKDKLKTLSKKIQNFIKTKKQTARTESKILLKNYRDEIQKFKHVELRKLEEEKKNLILICNKIKYSKNILPIDKKKAHLLITGLTNLQKNIVQFLTKEKQQKDLINKKISPERTLITLDKSGVKYLDNKVYGDVETIIKWNYKTTKKHFKSILLKSNLEELSPLLKNNIFILFLLSDISAAKKYTFLFKKKIIQKAIQSLIKDFE